MAIITPATSGTSVREANAIAKKQLALRDQLWPGIKPELWDRLAHKGFTTIPKTMPLILKLMDSLSKAAPLSSTYLGLWCSTWDNSFTALSKSKDLAFAAGFSGQRAEYVWSTRMKRLQELGFIDIKAGKSGPMSYAIILNPHFVLRRLHQQGKFKGVLEADYTALIDLALEVGAKDMTDTVPLPAPSAGAAPPPAKVAKTKRTRTAGSSKPAVTDDKTS